MKCVIDTSALSWLARVDYLWLLKEIYEGVYAPQIIFDELKPHNETRDFVENHLERIILSEHEEKKLKLLADKWQRWTGSKDRGDIEVFVAYHFFSKADEMLFANEGAVNSFAIYGGARDIITLYELAEKKNIFSKKDAIEYLRKLENMKYRTNFIPKLVESLLLFQ